MSDIVFSDQLKAWRHFLHQHPETAFEETVTANFVAKTLTDMGYEVNMGIGGTGVVASLTVGNGKEAIGLRADMDGINLAEMGSPPYKSQNSGKMHACGHDGHTATLLGAAKLLKDRQNFSGTVRLVFQPAEEPGKGAIAMLADGLLERFPMDEIYGLHNMCHLKEGTISTCKGGIMASEDNFIIRIKGKGAHASTPHLSVDPLLIACEIILALQTIISRNQNPIYPAVISCTEISTDGARNAIPTHVVIKGDTRSTRPQVQQLIEARMRTIAEGICQLNGAECLVEYTHEFSPTLNWDACVDVAAKAAAKVVGEDCVFADGEPMMGSEDFGVFLEKIPGCFVFLGSGKSDVSTENIPLHNSLYDYNDNILETGAAFFAELISTRLPQHPPAGGRCGGK